MPRGGSVSGRGAHTAKSTPAEPEPGEPAVVPAHPIPGSGEERHQLPHGGASHRHSTRCAHRYQSVAARPKGPVRPEPVAPCRGRQTPGADVSTSSTTRPGAWAKLGCRNVRRARARQSRQPGDNPGVGGWVRPVPRAQGVAAGRCARGRLRHPNLPGSVRGAMIGSVLQTCGGPDEHIAELAD